MCGVEGKVSEGVWNWLEVSELWMEVGGCGRKVVEGEWRWVEVDGGGWKVGGGGLR